VRRGGADGSTSATRGCRCAARAAAACTSCPLPWPLPPPPTLPWPLPPHVLLPPRLPLPGWRPPRAPAAPGKQLFQRCNICPQHECTAGTRMGGSNDWCHQFSRQTSPPPPSTSVCCSNPGALMAHPLALWMPRIAWERASKSESIYPCSTLFVCEPRADLYARPPAVLILPSNNTLLHVLETGETRCEDQQAAPLLSSAPTPCFVLLHLGQLPVCPPPSPRATLTRQAPRM
jgi:hypothetical protein